MSHEIKLTYANAQPDGLDIKSLAVSAAAPFDDVAVAAARSAFFTIQNPDFAYLAATSVINIDDIPSYTTVNAITDGFQTITFSTPMEKLPPSGINNWGVPPFTEAPDKPATLISNYSATSMTWTLSRPAKVFGVELMPNLFGTYTYRLEYFSGEAFAGSITRTITVPGPPLGPASQGARLFAAITDDLGFDRVVITSLSGNTLGFLVAQIRYQGCVTLCNVIVENTAEKGTRIPVRCCISVPGFEVVSVSNDIKANILATCCDVQEDFVCPGFGLIPGVKTAAAVIFAELLIPVTIQAGTGGCPPITMPYICRESVVFTIDDVFVASDIKNCKVISVSQVKGTDFQVTPVTPGAPHCCVTGRASLSAKVSACVMTNSIQVAKC